MSPTVFRFKGYRFYFFSREETRRHVHVSGADGEAKFWLEPVVSLADATGLDARKLRELMKVIDARKSALIKAWDDHFGG